MVKARRSFKTWLVFCLVLYLGCVSKVGSGYLVLNNDNIDVDEEKQFEARDELQQDGELDTAKQQPDYKQGQITKVKEEISNHFSPTESAETIHPMTISNHETFTPREAETPLFSSLFETPKLSSFALPFGSHQEYWRIVNSDESHATPSTKASHTLPSSSAFEHHHIPKEASLSAAMPLASYFGKTEDYPESEEKKSQLTPQSTEALHVSDWLTRGYASKSKATKRTESISESSKPFAIDSLMSQSTVTDSEKVTDGLSKGFGGHMIDKQKNFMATDKDPGEMERLSTNFGTLKVKSSNRNEILQSSYRLDSEAYGHNFDNSESSLQGSGHNTQFSSPKHSQMTDTTYNSHSIYTAKIEGHTSRDGRFARMQVAKQSLKADDGEISRFKTISGPLHIYSLRSSIITNRKVPDRFSERDMSGTKHYGSNSFNRPMQSIKRGITSSNLPSSTVKLKRIQSARTVLYSTGSSTTATPLQSNKLMENQITQTYDQVVRDHVKPSKPGYEPRMTTVQSRDTIGKETRSMQDYKKVSANREHSIPSLKKVWDKTNIASSTYHTKYNLHTTTTSATPLHERLNLDEKLIYTSLSSVHTPTLLSSIVAEQGKAPLYFSQSIPSIKRVWNETTTAPSAYNTHYTTASPTPLYERFNLNEKFISASLSSVHIALLPSLAANQMKAPLHFSQSLTDKYTGKLLPSFSASPSFSTLIGVPSESAGDKDSSLTKTIAITKYETYGDTTVHEYHVTTNSVFELSTVNQIQREVGVSENVFQKPSESSFITLNISVSEGNPVFSAQRKLDSNTNLRMIPPYSISVGESRIKTDRPSAVLLRNSQQIYASTRLDVTKNHLLPLAIKSSFSVLFASNSAHPTHSTSLISYPQLPSSITKPTKSSGVSAKLSTYLEEFEDECTYHSIKNIQNSEVSEELKFEMEDIMSLKIKRIIAVKWPYTGYLGRAGFIHRGLVVQTMDGRFWYNHMKSTERQIYIVFLDALTNLHRRIQIIYSQEFEDGSTLKEYVDIWGFSIGMYFKTCYDKKWTG